MRRQPVGYRPQVERSLADPAGQRRAVQFETGTRIDLSLAIQRTMLGVFGDQHMGDGAFGRQRALDQPSRRRRLGHAFLAPAAGVFRAHRDDHPQLRRHDVEPLGAIFADPYHLPAAAGIKRAFRLDHLLDPGQVFRQMAEIARRARPLRPAGRRRVFRRRRGLDLLRRALKLLERQLALVRRQPLRPLAIHKADQLEVQMLQTADALGLLLVLGPQRLQRRKRLPRCVPLFGRQRVEVHLRKRSHGPLGSTASEGHRPRSEG